MCSRGSKGAHLRVPQSLSLWEGPSKSSRARRIHQGHRGLGKPIYICHAVPEGCDRMISKVLRLSSTYSYRPNGMSPSPKARKTLRLQTTAKQRKDQASPKLGPFDADRPECLVRVGSLSHNDTAQILKLLWRDYHTREIALPLRYLSFQSLVSATRYVFSLVIVRPLISGAPSDHFSA